MEEVLRFKMLVAQRTGSYEEQYAPELLVAVDEFTDEENPGYFRDECKRNLALFDSEDLLAHTVVEVAVPLREIVARLFPGGDPVRGEVL